MKRLMMEEKEENNVLFKVKVQKIITRKTKSTIAKVSKIFTLTLGQETPSDPTTPM